MVPEKLKGKLGYKKLIELQFQYLEIDNKIQFYLMANVERKLVFNVNCKELLDMGFDVTGYEVVHSEIIPNRQKVLAPSEDFVGKVIKINENVAIVDSAVGEVELKLDELFLLKSTRNIGECTMIIASSVVDKYR